MDDGVVEANVFQDKITIPYMRPTFADLTGFSGDEFLFSCG